MYISNSYGSAPTRITVDSSDTIGEIASYIHMTNQELCEAIQKIVDDDLDNYIVSSSSDSRPSRCFID